MLFFLMTATKFLKEIIKYIFLKFHQNWLHQKCWYRAFRFPLLESESLRLRHWWLCSSESALLEDGHSPAGCTHYHPSVSPWLSACSNFPFYKDASSIGIVVKQRLPLNQVASLPFAYFCWNIFIVIVIKLYEDIFTQACIYSDYYVCTSSALLL